MTEGGIFTGSVGSGPGRAGGAPLPGVELRLADDGEIQARTAGANARLPRRSGGDRRAHRRRGWSTPATWRLRPRRLLGIIGRKKELIVTAGGKKIAPEEVEGLLRGLPGIAQAIGGGDHRPYLVALSDPRPGRGAPARGEAASPPRRWRSSPPTRASWRC